MCLVSSLVGRKMMLGDGVPEYENWRFCGEDTVPQSYTYDADNRALARIATLSQIGNSNAISSAHHLH